MRAPAISITTATPTPKTPPETLPVFLEMVLEEVGTTVVVFHVEGVSLVVLSPTAMSSMIFFNDVILLILLVDIIVVSLMTDGEIEATLESVGELRLDDG